MSTNLFIWIIVGIIAILVISVIVVLNIKPPQVSGMEQQEKHLLRITRYLKRFDQYDRVFITRQSIRFLHNSISELGIYDEFEAKVQAVQMFHKSLSIFFFISLGVIILFRDLLITIIGVLGAYLIKDTIVTKKLYFVHFEMLNQVAEALSAIKQEYLRTNNVLEALSQIDCGDYVKPSITKIYRILSSPNTDDELERYSTTHNLKAIQTLAFVAHLINSKGDEKLANGQSNFIEALSMIENEVRFEINRLLLQNTKFKKLDWLPIVPLILVLPIKLFFTKILPGTTALYNGTFGYTALVILLIASLFCYRRIMLAQAPVAVRYDDRTQFDYEMVNNKYIRRIVYKFIPRREEKIKKLLDLITDSQSRLKIEHIYFRKIFYFIIGFISSMVIMFTAAVIGYVFTVNDYNSPSLGASPPKGRELDIVKQLDLLYFSSNPIKDDNELSTFINKHTRGLSQSQREAQLARIRAKERNFALTKFKFWWIWIWFSIGMIGWILPEILMSRRYKAIQNEAQEDCLQLQTIISILMYTRLDTLDVLDWLSKNSRVFQPILIDAFHRYPSNPEQAIRALRERAGLPDFRRLCDKLLLTVYQVSLEEGFSDLVAERQHLLARRNILQENAINVKRAAMSPIALIPLIILIATYFAAPIGIIGVAELQNSIKILNNSENLVE